MIAARVAALSRAAGAAPDRRRPASRVGGAVATKAAARLRDGDADRGHASRSPTPLEVAAEDIPLAILFEDADLIVLDKPAGLVVHPARRARARHAGQRAAPSLQGPLGHRRRAAPGHRPPARQGHQRRDGRDQVRSRARRAHRGVRGQEPRRDRRAPPRPTSRSPRRLRRATPRHAPHAVRAPSRSTARSSRRRSTTGKSAVTHWEVVEPLHGAALVRLRLETGRTHQIRVHAADHGWPLLGDPVYGQRRATTGSRRRPRRSAARHCTRRPSRSSTR